MTRGMLRNWKKLVSTYMSYYMEHLYEMTRHNWRGTFRLRFCMCTRMYHV